MSIDKKCPNCGKWTSWNQKLSDRCGHCNEILDQRRVSEVEEFHERERTYNERDMFRIRESDGPIMMVTRRIMWFFHVVFGAIAWLFIWMFASTPG